MELNLQKDYTTIGLEVMSNQELQKICGNDFALNLLNLLKSIGCDLYYQGCVCQSLIWSMLSNKNSYHNPTHILHILSFAKNNNIELEDWEVLAIYFHDAIYRPFGKQNEANSIQFMLSLLNETGVDKNVLTKAAFGIQSTAMHLETFVEKDFEKLLDLDVCMFAASRDIFLDLCYGIELEYYRKDEHLFTGITEKQFLTGRLDFLKKLKYKKSIFRTKDFLEKHEKTAQDNISYAIIICEERLKNI